MKRKRITIPREAKDAVLKEFNHRCAICGADHPQVHHLDEDPSNNDSLNLIPLCPNCHLSDQHSPWRNHHPKKLRLFRIHKDRAILAPQFEPLFRRLAFIQQSPCGIAFVESACDLIAFVQQLKMGDYYARKIETLLSPSGISVLDVQPDQGEFIDGTWEKIQGNGDDVIGLIIELLRFQDWRLEPQRGSDS